MSPENRNLPPAVLDRPVVGRNLLGATFRDNVDARPTLVAFLRHFG
jgi:hypothetical protein